MNLPRGGVRLGAGNKISLAGVGSARPLMVTPRGRLHGHTTFQQRAIEPKEETCKR